MFAPAYVCRKRWGEAPTSALALSSKSIAEPNYKWVGQVSLLRPGFPRITTHPKVADMLCAPPSKGLNPDSDL